MKYFPAFMKLKCIDYYRIYLVRTSVFEVYKYSKNLDFEKVTGKKQNKTKKKKRN